MRAASGTRQPLFSSENRIAKGEDIQSLVLPPSPSNFLGL